MKAERTFRFSIKIAGIFCVITCLILALFVGQRRESRMRDELSTLRHENRMLRMLYDMRTEEVDSLARGLQLVVALRKDDVHYQEVTEHLAAFSTRRIGCHIDDLEDGSGLVLYIFFPAEWITKNWSMAIENPASLFVLVDPQADVVVDTHLFDGRMGKAARNGGPWYWSWHDEYDVEHEIDVGIDGINLVDP